jgi:RNA polymerase sigma-70 factor (ECF subfamily)
MRLFVAHEPRIHAYIRSLVFHHADAQDILQEVAVVLWRKFSEFQPGTHFDRWAYRIAHLQVLYYRQKKQRDRLEFSEEVLSAVADTMELENARWQELEQAMLDCVEKLRGEDRDLLRQRFAPGSNNRQIAHATGRSETAISRALSRVYAALLRCVEMTMQPLPRSH